jgi:2',3'-cyclic-nucleotide 2'-phosphodiesterase
MMKVDLGGENSVWQRSLETMGEWVGNGNGETDFEISNREQWPRLAGVRILFIADVVGQPGRRAVRELLPRLRLRHPVELVIANGENVAGGSGITRATAEELYASGVDVLTSGDHLWDQKEVMQILEGDSRFVRPGNYPPGTPGQGSTLIQARNGVWVGVVNAQGRTFMPPMENPFVWVAAEVERLRARTRVVVVDFHAEATSEKIAMGRMLDGQVTALVGTHTHVQTADERIFPGGTAFLCDAGYTGPHESVIGREIEPVIHKFRTGQLQRFEVAKAGIRLQGVWIDVDVESGRAVGIERVNEGLEPVPGEGEQQR